MTTNAKRFSLSDYAALDEPENEYLTELVDAPPDSVVSLADQESGKLSILLKSQGLSGSLPPNTPASILQSGLAYAPDTSQRSRT